jgi:predicted PurR-regulated permease PerM
VRSAALNGLFGLACVYTLAIGRNFLLPLAAGLMVYFLLRPPVRALRRARIPEPVGAAMVLLALVTTVVLGLYALSWPAAAWMARGPESVQRVESRLRPITKRIQRLTRTAAEMERITSVTEAPSDTPKVEMREATLRGQLVGGVQSLVAGAIIVVTLVYFLLAEGDAFVSRVVQVLPRLKDRKRAVEIARTMERQISSYLFFTTLINASFGLLIGLVLWALGMPNPALWGFVAGVLKFVPYLGGLITTVVFALAALLSFPDLMLALLVPVVFFVIDTLHGNFLVPALLGHRFTLDTAVLFVGLLFWWYVWGTAGVLLAVPMMVAFRIFCERVEGLRPLAEFMSGQGGTAPALEPTAGTDHR